MYSRHEMHKFYTDNSFYYPQLYKPVDWTVLLPKVNKKSVYIFDLKCNNEVIFFKINFKEKSGSTKSRLKFKIFDKFKENEIFNRFE